MDPLQPVNDERLFTLVNAQTGERVSHESLPLLIALAKWGRILRQEHYCVACLGGAAEVRLAQVYGDGEEPNHDSL